MKQPNFLKKYIEKRNQAGFTILETMVAVFILVLSVTGPMVFASSSLRSAFLARDQITAFYLAQDVIETIKNIRDENGINERDWLTNIDVCAGTAGAACTLKVDTTEDNPVAEECDGDICEPLSRDANGRFDYGSAEDSRFTRTTYVQEIVENQEARVIVEVKWQSNVRIGTTRILVQENIMNWIPVSTSPDDEE